MEKVTIDYDYHLTVDELNEKGKELATVQSELHEVEAYKKVTVAKLNASIKNLKHSTIHITNIMTTGKEKREELCTIDNNYEYGERTYTSVKTKKVIKTEKISTDSVQGDMFVDK